MSGAPPHPLGHWGVRAQVGAGGGGEGRGGGAVLGSNIFNTYIKNIKKIDSSTAI